MCTAALTGWPTNLIPWTHIASPECSLLTRLNRVDAPGLLVSDFCTGTTVEKGERKAKSRGTGWDPRFEILRPRSKGMVWKSGNLTTNYELFIYICTRCSLDVRLVSCRLQWNFSTSPQKVTYKIKLEQVSQLWKIGFIPTGSRSRNFLSRSMSRYYLPGCFGELCCNIDR